MTRPPLKLKRSVLLVQLVNNKFCKFPFSVSTPVPVFLIFLLPDSEIHNRWLLVHLYKWVGTCLSVNLPVCIRYGFLSYLRMSFKNNGFMVNTLLHHYHDNVISIIIISLVIIDLSLLSHSTSIMIIIMTFNINCQVALSIACVNLLPHLAQVYH